MFYRPSISRSLTHSLSIFLYTFDLSLSTTHFPAIRPDRDIIGKQKNPRRKKLKREDSSLPSPGSDSPSPHEDVLVTFLVDVELQSMGGPAARTPLPIGIQRIKSEPDMDISSLFNNRFAYEQEAYEVTYRSPQLSYHFLSTESPLLFQMGYSVERVASVEQLASALRRYLFAAVHWIEALFSLAQIENVPEKVTVLKSVFAPYTILCQAARTAQLSRDVDVICLCNRTTITRQPPRHLLETNLLANNLVPRILDDLVAPMRKLSLSEAEIVVLSALVILDPVIQTGSFVTDSPGLSEASSLALSQLRDRVQNALFQLIRENSSALHCVTSRFGNILLLLPPLAKLSSLVGENVQFARMFGGSLDPLLVELFADNTSEVWSLFVAVVEPDHNISSQVIPSPSTRERTDVSTQTYASASPALPSDLGEMHEEIPACTEPTRPAPVLPTGGWQIWCIYIDRKTKQI
ncbi:Ligand-binding domain of nuclear hormone receptor [Ancylostoma duodenale]|uniref:Ligand-binding domain of nuclear hormone receptor n=1 Tax=Ancylostoma duodenale TaxID=51022 RepID=A0A0C2BTI8_9BILA|nr:Ligand-binding domain of nuclear hormone receptor [Ancylostoma duodenale]